MGRVRTWDGRAGGSTFEKKSGAHRRALTHIPWPADLEFYLLLLLHDPKLQHFLFDELLGVKVFVQRKFDREIDVDANRDDRELVFFFRRFGSTSQRVTNFFLLFPLDRLGELL